MEGYSQAPKEERLKRLKAIFPEVFDEGKIDWEKLKATLGEAVNFSNERYVLNWAGKSEAFRTLQQPTSETLAPAKNESVNFDTTRNIFIEGENLEVLKILQKSYFGKVKMIYIDPPYNTGNDNFIYPDKFSESKDDYLKRVGDKDENGYMMREGMFRKNSKENGQYHSNWLNMMMPRLYLAKNLLRDDGVIFISIDDNEVYNLRLLMNEIFGEENFIGSLIIETATDNNPSQISVEHEYMLCFAKTKELQGAWLRKNESADLIQQEYLRIKHKTPDIKLIQQELRQWIKKHKSELPQVSHYDNVDEKGVYHDADIANTKMGGYYYDVIHPRTHKVCKIPDKGFRFPEETMRSMILNNDIMFGEDETTLIKPKKRLEDAKELLRSVIYEDGRASTKIVDGLVGRGVFNNPKSIRILYRLIDFCTKDNDIILDFFAGSGTTAHAVMQLNKEDGGNRQFICVQLPELCDEKSEAFKAGYKTIAEISKERIRRAAKKIQSEIDAENEKKKGELPFEGTEQTPTNIDLGFKVLKLHDSNFKQWKQIKNNDIEELTLQMQDFNDPVSPNATIENMVYELMLKSGKDLNSTIEHKGGYYCINGNEMILMLETATDAIVTAVLAEHPQKVIALDRLFKDNDQLKTNTALQMRDAGVEFKTI